MEDLLSQSTVAPSTSKEAGKDERIYHRVFWLMKERDQLHRTGWDYKLVMKYDTSWRYEADLDVYHTELYPYPVLLESSDNWEILRNFMFCQKTSLSSHILRQGSSPPFLPSWPCLPGSIKPQTPSFLRYFSLTNNLPSAIFWVKPFP